MIVLVGSGGISGRRELGGADAKINWIKKKQKKKKNRGIGEC